MEQWSDGLDGEADEGLIDDGHLIDDGLIVDDDVVAHGDVLADDLTSAELDIDGTLLDSIETELADVERALALLDEGTYGQCEHCGAIIDDDVLAHTPTARFCAQHLPFALR